MAQKSSHILNTSSNLLGLCFLVLTSLKLFDLKQKSLVDEAVTAAALLFMFSTLLSFLSIRTETVSRSNRYETIADYSFLAGLAILFLVIITIALDII